MFLAAWSWRWRQSGKNYLANDTASHPRRLDISVLLWEPQIWHSPVFLWVHELIINIKLSSVSCYIDCVVFVAVGTKRLSVDDDMAFCLTWQILWFYFVCVCVCDVLWYVAADSISNIVENSDHRRGLLVPSRYMPIMRHKQGSQWE